MRIFCFFSFSSSSLLVILFWGLFGSFFWRTNTFPERVWFHSQQWKSFFKINPTAIYVLGALGLFVISSVKIAACPQDSCCSKTHGAFRHPCVMLILIPSCRDPVESAHDNRSKLCFRIGKRYINMTLSSTPAIPWEMLTDRTSQSSVKSAY